MQWRRRSGWRSALQLAAELGLHRVVAEVGDVADHPRHPQPAPRQCAVLVEVATVEVGVGDDRPSGHLVEGDVLCRQVGRGGHGDAVAQPRGVAQRPVERLHAAQAAAQHGGQPLDAQRVHQPGLGVDPVLDRDDGKVGAPGAPGRRIDVHRPGRAEARTGIVHADDEEAVGVQRFAGSDEVVPPAFALRLPFVGAGDVVRGIQRVADQHRVAAVGIERAVGLVDQRVVGELRAAAQRERLRELHRPRCDVPDGAHEVRNPMPLQKRTPGRASLFSGICRAPAIRNKSALGGSIAAAFQGRGGAVSMKLGRVASLSCRRCRFGCALRQSICGKRKSR